MNKTTNAAHKFPMITIHVISVQGNIVSYNNFHQLGGKVYRFSATIGIDRETIALLEPGKNYAIMQTVDSTNTTHWTQAMPYSGGPRPTADLFAIFNAKKKAKRVVNPDFLEW